MNLDDSASVLDDLLHGRRPDRNKLQRGIRALEWVEDGMVSGLHRDLRDVVAILRKLAAGDPPNLDQVARGQVITLIDAIEKLNATDAFALKFEKVALEEQNEDSRRKAVRSPPVHLRKTRDPGSADLQKATVKWINSLPAGARPQKLASRYPRVANNLAAAWPHPAAFNARLNEFLFTDRQNRQGFPEDVAKELASLKEHFTKTVNHVDTDVWTVNNFS